MSTSQSHPLPRPPPVPQHHGFYDDQYQHYQSQPSDSQPLPPLHQYQSSPENQSFPRLSSYPYQPPQQQPQHHHQQQAPLPSAHQSHRSHQSQSSRGQPSLEDDRPRSRPRTFSLRSDKSHSNSIDLHETHAEKEARRLHSKADPTLAMNEAEPTVVAATVKSSLAPLRNMQHKDYQGNVIDDPDRSNPTRNRWERPLDTIRSFEAAIDGNYSSRQSIMMRSDSDSVSNWNRRSSYYGGNNHSSSRVNNRYQSRDSYFSLRPNQSEYGYGNEGDMAAPRGYNAYGHGPQQRYSRMASEPHYSTPRHAEPLYPIQSHHRSYETVASGSGSGISGDPTGYTTDPTSSDNSSIERMQSPPKRQPEPPNDYGIGFSQSPTYAPQSFTVGGPPAQNGSSANSAAVGTSGHDVPPAVPQKPNMITRKPTQQSVTSNGPERPSTGEKRKSWFSRRFSKNS